MITLGNTKVAADDEVGAPRALQSLFDQHLEVRLRLEELLQTEELLMAELVAALAPVPRSRLGSVVRRAVERSVRRLAT